MQFARPTRHLWLAVAAFTLSACSGGGGSGTVPTPGGPSPSFRGTVKSFSTVTTITVAQMEADQSFPIIYAVGGAPQCDVTLYTIDYNTVGAFGEQANADEGLFVPGPACGSGPFPLIGYAHGTNLVKAQNISDPTTYSPTFTAPDQDPYVVAAIFASQGYVVSATDYLGLGTSTYPFHPYLQVATESTSVIDALRAARTVAAKSGVALSGQVLLTGHSQGGQVTMATQRAIEAQYPEFDLVGSAPSSGPYDLTQTFLDSLANQSQDAPLLAAYILTGYNKTYKNVYSTPTDVFLQPYASGIDSLLPVATFQDEIPLLEGVTLPLELNQLLTPAFYSSFEGDANSGARQDTAKNDLLSGWVAKAPQFICGGSQDPEVEFKNALAAQSYFNAVGSRNVLTDVNLYVEQTGVPMSDYHVTVADFCLTLARVEFFDGLVNTAAHAKKTFGKRRL
jgi:pimeloyl-ACP methyl ester carboxylesterase